MTIVFVISFFVSFFVFLCITYFYYMKKFRRTIEFIAVLMADYTDKMTKGLLNRESADEYPTEVDEVLKKFYPRLPLYEKICDYPLSELIEKVDWTIDPHKYLAGIKNAKNS